MMIVFFVYTTYSPGDEHIIQDSLVLAVPETKTYYHGQQLLDVYPNPAVNDIVIKCYMDMPDIGSIQLADIQGNVVRRYADRTNLN